MKRCYNNNAEVRPAMAGRRIVHLTAAVKCGCGTYRSLAANKYGTNVTCSCGTPSTRSILHEFLATATPCVGTNISVNNSLNISCSMILHVLSSLKVKVPRAGTVGRSPSVRRNVLGRSETRGRLACSKFGVCSVVANCNITTTTSRT